MGKLKIIFTSVMLTIALVVTAFGIYSAVTQNKGITNSTEFVSGDENVFVLINGEYSGPDLTQGATPTYTFEINKNTQGAYSDGGMLIPSWRLGNTYFTSNKPDISIIFSFKNLNTENALLVDISKIAYDQQQRFYTYTAFAESKDDLASAEQKCSTQEATASMQQITINAQETVFVEIKFSLQDFSKTIEDIANNIQIVFSTQV